MGEPSTSAAAQQVHRVSAEAAQAFVEAVLCGNGASEQDARTVAGCLIEADLHGVDTHGEREEGQFEYRRRADLTFL